MPTASPVVVSELPALPPRAPDSHKGDFGRVLIVAGSRGMSGAAVLCATAALRGGAGLVRAAVPADGRLAPAAEADVLRLAAASDVIAAGPGLGQSPAVAAIVRALLTRTAVPLVLDADALNVLAGQADALRGRKVPPVLTPHPGEF